MRTFVILLLLGLTLSGLVSFGMRQLAFQHPLQQINLLMHIWAGLAFAVVFPLYAWQHINQHRLWLKRFSLTTVSGLIQTSCGTLLILSGIILMLYHPQNHSLLLQLHLQPTIYLLAALLLHHWSSKS